MPVGFVCVLQVSEHFQYVRLPSCLVFWGLDLPSPRCCEERFTSLSGLNDVSKIADKEAEKATYRQDIPVHEFVYNGHELVMGFEDRL